MAEGSVLYSAAIEAMGAPEGRRAVPMLFVGDVVLVGSVEIPDELPGIIERGLSQGGIAWPAIPGLAQALGEPQTPATPAQPRPAEPKTVAERLQQDPLGNTLAIVVLIAMVLSLVAVAARWVLKGPTREVPFSSWMIPLLSLLGMGVAVYLTIIELSGDPAVCGPVGDCNAVQQSPYAFMFGVFPVGALGVIGFGAIILAWATTRFLPDRASDLMRILLFAMAVIGTCFSIYLTFLEPFVIGATCLWCLSSAVISTLLLLLAIPPGKLAFTHLMVKKD